MSDEWLRYVLEQAALAQTGDARAIATVERLKGCVEADQRQNTAEVTFHGCVVKRTIAPAVQCAALLVPLLKSQEEHRDQAVRELLEKHGLDATKVPKITAEFIAQSGNGKGKGPAETASWIAARAAGNTSASALSKLQPWNWESEDWEEFHRLLGHCDPSEALAAAARALSITAEGEQTVLSAGETRLEAHQWLANVLGQAPPREALTIPEGATLVETITRERTTADVSFGPEGKRVESKTGTWEVWEFENRRYLRLVSS